MRVGRFQLAAVMENFVEYESTVQMCSIDDKTSGRKSRAIDLLSNLRFIRRFLGSN
jgi:hypothetical protein